MYNDKIISCFKLCRPAHAIKNLLILLPPFFGRRILSIDTLANCSVALLSFSLIASSVYVINDICDRKKDKEHPVKCNRPLASGKISVSPAIMLTILLITSGNTLIFFYAANFTALILAGIYLLINIAYSLSLKNKPVTDIFILASGFVLRVYFGGTFFNITISPWLFLCVLCGALCFAVGKRRNELRYQPSSNNSRPVLKYYNENYLNSSYYLLCGGIIVFFSLWTIFATQHNNFLQYSIPVVMFIMFRYNLIIENENTDGDPVTVLIHDKLLIILTLIFTLISFIGLYLV